ncbi:hypothetical protein [Flavihumibacter sp. CACIAM 22H1]|uniref:hypothetical protein n=1 Tax=Flavihumibacter sp. CACIAM 22H1 TaxID=1812911 RepID=UPI0007A82CAC|nr:hypothetical protein [Flavihumibacter sp. CACIAM 22H1]KYP13444.1 MAG: hypothetical protein A1D16_19770 [Flavihumibacter sp. CACIAM 22H1]
MRFIKLIAISFVAFFLLLTAFTSLIPSTVRISRAVDVQAEKSKLLPYLQDMNQWKSWNLWMQDSTRQITVQAVLPGDSVISAQWVTGDKKLSSNYAVYQVKPGILTVQWYFDVKLAWYPWEKLGSIIYDKQMGPVMEESLANLKRLVESNP